MRPSWDPTRRNRNIGTSKHGRGQDNRMVIPESYHRLTVYWNNLTSLREVVRKVRGRRITFLVERTRKDCAHACTVDDIVKMMRFFPADDLEDLALVVLRQPKRKENLLHPVWGRLDHSVEIGRHQGPAILLEAVDLARPFSWPKSLRPDEALELQRLREDGHVIRQLKRGYVLDWDLKTVRSSQLYQTLPHEVGHWVQYLEAVERPARRNTEAWERLSDKYWQKPDSEGERFAHRYADELRRRLLAAGSIPFERKVSGARLVRQGLRAEDFML